MIQSINRLVVLNDNRGMITLLDSLPPDPASRAAEAIFSSRAAIFLCTGFPVSGSPETDGPLGSIALWNALSAIQKQVKIVTFRPLIKAMREFVPPAAFVEIPCGLPPQIKLEGVAITIEACGRTPDGKYLNMRGVDITANCPWFEDAFGICSLVSIGDGGNEFGMGSAPDEWFCRFGVKKPVSRSCVLVPGQVSNWGALVVVGELSILHGKNLLPSPDVYAGWLSDLVKRGLVDGFSGKPEPREDGYPLEKTVQILSVLHTAVNARLRR